MNNLRFLLLPFFLLITHQVVSQGNGSFLTPDTIPFKLTSHNNLSIRGILNGTDTLDLMLHTAANSVTVTTKAAARLTSIPWTTETDVNSWGGKSKARFSERNTLNIGQLSWDSISIWETQNSGPTTEGKFGLNLFAGKVVDINFDEQIITLRNDLPKDLEGYQKLSLLSQDGSLFIEGTSTIDGQNYPNLFLIHSGYGSTILYDDEFVAKSNIGEHVKIVGEKALKDSYGNKIITKKGRLPELRIGGTSFTDLPVGFFEGAIGRQKMSVLGGDLIRRFNILLAADRKHIYLKANKGMKAPYTLFK
ncbi:MAG: aspartyl protease family protein [Lewinella sp.]